MKISENNEKITLPGFKKVLRFTDRFGMFYADGIFLQEEGPPVEIIHPVYHEKRSRVQNMDYEYIHNKVMVHGKKVLQEKPLYEVNEYRKSRLERLPVEHARFIRPHIYKVGISPALLDLRNNLIQHIRSKYE